MDTLILRVFLAFCLLFFSTQSFAATKYLKLIPKPKEVNFTKGETALSSDWKVCFWSENSDDAYAAELIAGEARDCFGWNWEIGPKTPQKQYILIREYTPGEEEPDLFSEQGYLLFIEENKIIIEAATATGRFYGAQTLRQIMRNTKRGRVPRLKIKDYPSLEWRGLSDDISRGQVSKLDDFKEIIRRLAFYKKNLYQPYIEDMFRFETDPEIGKERGAITKKEMQAMAIVAKKNHVVLTPVFECLGHQDRLLSLPENLKYAEIQDPKETPWSFSPVNEEAYQFVTQLIDEMAEAAPSPFFHIGGDESWDVGKGTSKNEVEKKGVGRVTPSISLASTTISTKSTDGRCCSTPI